MALSYEGKHFCKVIHHENGRTMTRRLYQMKVQAADGTLYNIDGKRLPESISLYTGQAYSGAHLADVLLNPKQARKDARVTTNNTLATKRDGIVLMIGLFFYQIVSALSEEVVMALM